MSVLAFDDLFPRSAFLNEMDELALIYNRLFPVLGAEEPGTVSGDALDILKRLLGDGNTQYGVGADHALSVENLISTRRQQVALCRADSLLNVVAGPYFRSLRGHIGSVGPTVCTDTPSFVTGSTPYLVTDVDSYARYFNDPNTDPDLGVLWKCVVPWQAAWLIWLFNSGSVLLDARTVFPPTTALGSFNCGTSVFTAGSAINRYSKASSASWIQGYAAQAIRARVTVAGSGTAAITAGCEGMEGTPTDPSKAAYQYFGRATAGGEDADGNGVGDGVNPPTDTGDRYPTPRNFTGSLAMGVVGNTVPLLHGITGDRALKVLSVAATGGATGQFVIETVPDRDVSAGTTPVVIASGRIEKLYGPFSQGDGGAWDANRDTRIGGTSTHYQLTLSETPDPNYRIMVIVGKKFWYPNVEYQRAGAVFTFLDGGKPIQQLNDDGVTTTPEPVYIFATPL